jgi:hypothetical protein
MLTEHNEGALDHNALRCNSSKAPAVSACLCMSMLSALPAVKSAVDTLEFCAAPVWLAGQGCSESGSFLLPAAVALELLA